jgi:hypothetical protein
MAVVGHRLGQRGGDRLPHAGLAPASEALAEGHPLAVLLRHVAPWRAGANAPQDAVDRPPQVFRRPTGARFRQRVLQDPPLTFAQIARFLARVRFERW